VGPIIPIRAVRSVSRCRIWLQRYEHDVELHAAQQLACGGIVDVRDRVERQVELPDSAP